MCDNIIISRAHAIYLRNTLRCIFRRISKPPHSPRHDIYLYFRPAYTRIIRSVFINRPAAHLTFEYRRQFTVSRTRALGTPQIDWTGRNAFKKTTIIYFERVAVVDSGRTTRTRSVPLRKSTETLMTPTTPFSDNAPRSSIICRVNVTSRP